MHLASLLFVHTPPHRASLRTPGLRRRDRGADNPASSDSPLQTLGGSSRARTTSDRAGGARRGARRRCSLGGDGAVGVIVMERCRLYFRAAAGRGAGGGAPARLLATNLSVAVPADGEGPARLPRAPARRHELRAAAVGGGGGRGVRRGARAAAADLDVAHTGVVAVDAPRRRPRPELRRLRPRRAARRRRAQPPERIIGAQAQLGTGVRTVAVVAGGEAERAAALDALAEAARREYAGSARPRPPGRRPPRRARLRTNGDDALVVIDIRGAPRAVEGVGEGASRAGVG